MKETTFAEEKEWLDFVCKNIDEQLAKQEEQTRSYHGEMLKTRTSLWEEHGISTASANQLMDVAQQITELRHSASLFGVQKRALDNLRAAQKNPYFARMDFHEEGLNEKEALYIGVRSVIDHNTTLPLVYDWRAPVSSMFYDYGLGEAQYEGPGGVYRGQISLKRQYRIENRQLVYLFDNELKIDDEVLQAALSERASETMRTIVNTIQREQNQAIRNDYADQLLVEGPAGSGKTSVALHRIAYLLYKYREIISSQNIVIFSPSQIFSQYIGHVLPELGEENVYQTTFQDFAEPFLGWKWDLESHLQSLESLLGEETCLKEKRLQIQAFKSSEQFRQILDNLIALIIKETTSFSDFKLGQTLIISGEEQRRLFFETYSYLPLNKRLTKIYERICFLIRPIRKRRLKQTLNQVQSSPSFQDQSWWTIARETIRRVQDDLSPLMKRLEASFHIDSLSWYTRMWEKELWEQVAPDLIQPELAKKSLTSLAEGRISFEDQIPLLYLKGELEGYSIKRNIRHVVVDEVQDYAPLQLRILRKTFPRAKFTYVGDIYQSLNPYVWQSGKVKLDDLFEDLELVSVRLTKSYRSTQEIFYFCNTILPYQAEVETVLRSGPKPTLQKVEEKQKIAVLNEKIEKCLAAKYKTIAIICPTLADSEDVYRQLKSLQPGFEITFLDSGKATFKQGVIVAPVFLAKGLEFDAVILPEVNDQAYGDDEKRHLLYVACSRALHELYLLWSGSLSPFIQALPDDLYQKE